MELPASAWALKQVTTLWTAVTFISLEMPLNATYVKTYARLYLWYDAEAWCHVCGLTAFFGKSFLECLERRRCLGCQTRTFMEFGPKHSRKPLPKKPYAHTHYTRTPRLRIIL